MLEVDVRVRANRSIETKGLSLSCACLFAFACICGYPFLCAGSPAPSPVIVAYVFPMDNPLLPGNIAAQKLTRINYAFANIKDGRIVDGYAHDDRNLAFLVALKQQNPSLTVLVSVGGWLWSGSFSDMALTKQSRTNFISSVVDFVQPTSTRWAGYRLGIPGIARRRTLISASKTSRITRNW